MVRLCKRLGIATKAVSKYYSYGWEANARASINEEYGDVFITAHPGGVELFIADAEVIYDVLQRCHDFRRNMSLLC
jgi:hypothetical protein